MAYNNEKKRLKLEKKLNQTKEEELLKVTKIEKNQRYYDERGLIGLDEKISEFFDVDKETLLPYSEGYDYIIKDIKEMNKGEAFQDKIRDILIKLGFSSLGQIIKASEKIEIKESIDKINRRVYTSRHKIDPIPYKNVENLSDPRSQVIEGNEAEYFSEDYSDKEISDELDECIRKAKGKYDEFLNDSDANLSENDVIQEERTILGKILDQDNGVDSESEGIQMHDRPNYMPFLPT